MAQRKLNVKVSADIDKSLVDLLKKLDSTKARTLKVKAVIDDKAVTAFSDKMEKAVKKTTKTKMSIDDKDLDAIIKKVKDIEGDVVNVKFKADSVQLDKVSKVATELGNSFKKTHTLRVNDDGVETIGVRLNKVKDTTEKLTSKTHTVNYRAEGINEILNGLDNLASKTLSVAKTATMSLGRAIANDAKELYESQVSFMTQGAELEMSDERIKSAMNTLNDFGKTSKYSVAELNRLAIALKGAGFDEDFGGFENLTKNLAASVALSPTASQDLVRMSKVLQDLSPQGQATKGMWNQITRAIGGAGQTQMRELLRTKYGIDDLNKSFKQGQITGAMMVDVLNEVGKQGSYQKMATQANTVTSAFDNLRESLTVELTGTPFEKGVLSPIFDGLVVFLNKLQDATPQIGAFIGRLVELGMTNFGEAFKNFDIDKFINGMESGLKPLGVFVSLMSKLFGLLTNNGEHTGTIIGLAISLSTLYLATRKFASLASTLNKVFGGSGGFLGGLFGKGAGKEIASGMPAMDGLKMSAGKLIDTVRSLLPMIAIAGSLKLVASAYKDLADVKVSWGRLGTNLAQMVTMTTTMVTYIVAMNKGLSLLKTAHKDLAMGAVTLIGVSVALLAMAKIMQKLNGIRFDAGNIARELTQMTLTLIAFGGIAGAIGMLHTATGGVSAVAIGAGVATLLALAGSLVLLVEAVELIARGVADINKVNMPDSKAFASKMDNLFNIIQSLSFVGGVGGILSFVSGIVSFFGALGNLANALYIDSLTMLVAKVERLIEVSNKVPTGAVIARAIEKISGVLQAMRGDGGIFEAGESQGADFLEFWDSISDTLVNIVQGWELDTLMDNLTKFSDFIKKIMDAPIPEDLSGVRAKMTALKNLMDEMTRVTTEVMHSADQMKSTYTSSGSLGGVLSAMFQNMELDSLIPAMEKMAKFVEDLAGVPEIDASQMESIKTKLKNMNEVMNALKTALNDNGDGWDFGFLEDMVESWGSFFQKEDISNMTKGFKKLVDLTNSLIELQIDDSVVESIKTKMESIKKVMEELSKFEMPNIESIEGDTLKAIGSVKKLVEAMTEVINLVMGIPEQDISAKVTAIEKALTEIERLPKHTIFSNDAFDKDLTSKVDSISKFITALGTISQQLATIMGMPDLAGIEVKIGQIENALTAVSSDSFMQVLDKFKGKTDYGAIGTEIQTLVTALGQIATTLLNLPELESSVVTTKINAIKQSLETISADGGILTSVTKLQGKAEQFNNVKLVIDAVNNIATALSTVPDIAGLDIPTRLAKVAEALGAMTGTEGITGKVALLQGKTEQFTTAVSVINAVKTIVDTLNSIPAVNSEQLMTTITAIKNALNEIASINASGETLAGLDAVIAKLNELKTVVTTLATEMTTAGTNAGNNYATAFVAGIGTKLVDKMRTEMNAIIALDWAGTGTTIANKLVQAFETGIGTKLSDKVNKERLAIEAQDWSGTGTRISTALTNGFDISGILAKIQQIQTAINNLQGKTIEVTINQTTVERTVKRQHGGIIPEYHSTGGVIGRGWKQSGTDTVPAMLTAGEYVLKRSVSSYLGTQFLNALNNMNLTTAMKHLASKMGNQVVHNTTNNITQNVDNKASFLNGLNDLKGVIRA